MQKTYPGCICLKQDRRDFAFRRGTGKSSGKLDNAAIEAAKCWVYEENSAVMGKMQTIALRL